MEQGRWCAYDEGLSHTGAPICPAKEQATLMAHYSARAAAGDAWAGNMLRVTPCDLWPFLRGRTLWLLGDSITQARPTPPPRRSLQALWEFWACRCDHVHLGLTLAPMPALGLHMTARALHFQLPVLRVLREQVRGDRQNNPLAHWSTSTQDMRQG